jgi:DNA-binding MarR family transcriptional regulator
MLTFFSGAESMPADELKANETEDLRAEVATLRSELETLRQKWDADLDRVLREIAYDRQRLSKLEHPEDRDPTPTELAHLQRIEKHLKDSSRHAASFAELRGLLGVSPGRVSQLVKKLDSQRFEVKRSASDHKARVLVLKGRLSL